MKKLHILFPAVVGAFLGFTAFSFAQDAPVPEGAPAMDAPAPGAPAPDFDGPQGPRGPQERPGFGPGPQGMHSHMGIYFHIATEEQCAQMAEIRKEFQPKMEELMKQMKETQEAMANLHKEMMEKCQGVLTEEQLEKAQKWEKKMRGPREGFAPRDGKGPRKGFAPRDGKGPREGFAPRDGKGPRKDFAPRDDQAPAAPSPEDNRE